MNATIKSTGDVRFGNMEIDVTVPVSINRQYWDVYGTFNVQTLEFTANMVGVFGIDQFTRENGLDALAFNNKINRIVKRALRGDK